MVKINTTLRPIWFPWDLGCCLLFHPRLRLGRKINNNLGPKEIIYRPRVVLYITYRQSVKIDCCFDTYILCLAFSLWQQVHRLKTCRIRRPQRMSRERHKHPTAHKPLTHTATSRLSTGRSGSSPRAVLSRAAQSNCQSGHGGAFGVWTTQSVRSVSGVFSVFVCCTR